MNGSIGEWFKTTVGLGQGCLLSPTLFNFFLERIIALEEQDGKASTGGRNITNLRFADDIDALADEKQEQEALVESLDKTCTRYKMEISAEKTKLMTNSANGIQREITVKRQIHAIHVYKFLYKYRNQHYLQLTVASYKSIVIKYGIHKRNITADRADLTKSIHG